MKIRAENDPEFNGFEQGKKTRWFNNVEGIPKIGEGFRYALYDGKTVVRLIYN